MKIQRTSSRFLWAGCLITLLALVAHGCVVTDWVFSGGDGCDCDCTCTDLAHNPGIIVNPKECGDKARVPGDTCNDACKMLMIPPDISECHDATLPPPSQTPPPPPASICTPPATVATYFFCMVCPDGDGGFVDRANGSDFVQSACSKSAAHDFVQNRGVNCQVLDNKCDQL